MIPSLFTGSLFHQIANEHLIDEEFIKELKKKHLDELFTWLMIGSNRFYSEGIKPDNYPDCVKNVIKTENANQDTIQQFISYCDIDPTDEKSGRTTKTKLYGDYIGFCKGILHFKVPPVSNKGKALPFI